MVARLPEEKLAIWTEPRQHLREYRLDLGIREIHKKPVGKYQIDAENDCFHSFDVIQQIETYNHT